MPATTGNESVEGSLQILLFIKKQSRKIRASKALAASWQNSHKQTHHQSRPYHPSMPSRLHTPSGQLFAPGNQSQPAWPNTQLTEVIFFNLKKKKYLCDQSVATNIQACLHPHELQVYMKLTFGKEGKYSTWKDIYYC